MTRTPNARPSAGPWRWVAPVLLDFPEPADGPAPAGARLALRAGTTTASVETLFLWLCQLRRAPYSYDLLDNLDRRSPREADPRMLRLARGQAVMTIFAPAAFTPDRSLTMRMAPGLPTLLFGALALRYDVLETAGGRRPLRASLWWPCPGGPPGGLHRHLLA
ncbi:hypothetical protein [Brachybacterium sp. J153]|uniref:hypothetical protein n=1 Tax=Brachybacterium sp. J153 TaxID=3116488 RepID=UPI002E7A44CF|nr:hypothetical protein [Brachybacterium sp. J153]MEE1618129.1 hypothetical protein [Brachybacterium sp. J153]